jgi:hypothetical protein
MTHTVQRGRLGKVGTVVNDGGRMNQIHRHSCTKFIPCIGLRVTYLSDENDSLLPTISP